MEISTRESEVLALVGDHLSNAEIAARLYISVRTVESHVSALLRKLEAPDRRALARRAGEPAPAGGSGTEPVLPTPLTSFVGRAGELAELTGLLAKHRQVTAVGPGGVGKTRLALAVAADARAAHPDGVWFVDLVATTTAELVPAAVAAALGLGEQPGRDLNDSMIATLADRRALLVLDNCEQVRDGVALFLERLLASCPELTALATSRAPLSVPFERVYPVPPLSLPGEGGTDAITLFLDRAAAVGFEPGPDRHDEIAAICARLDGMALAIELAAARLPTLGLDGLSAGLADPLRMLAGGSRAAERHRSVRAALDWSHAMLTAEDRTLLRRVSVFAAPFTAEAAAEVADVNLTAALDGLARLAEQSLLTVTAASGRTEYRALETIRQYGDERLTESGEADPTRARHLRWCLTNLTDLADPRPTGSETNAVRPGGRGGRGVDTSEPRGGTAETAPTGRAAGEDGPGDTFAPASSPSTGRHGDASKPSAPVAGIDPSGREAAAVGPGDHAPAATDWRARFDLIADDCRSALAWAAESADHRSTAYQLAERLAELAFTRNLVGESQHRYEQAAALAADPGAAAVALRRAAAAAGCRMRGDDMYRLHRSAAAAARSAGDILAAAADVATAATAAFRFWGKFERVRPREEVLALVDEARRSLADETAAPAGPRVRAAAEAAVALAEAGVLSDAFGAIQGSPDNDVATTIARAERAVELAGRTADPLTESAALDALTGARSWEGDAFTVDATARRRVTLLASAPDGPATAHELVDALSTAAETSLGTGDLPGARRWARRLAEHPMLAEVGDRATSWLLVADALAGDAGEVLAGSERFLESWRRSGSPARTAFGPPVASVAMIHGLRGDADGRREWESILREVGTSAGHTHGFGAVFDAVLMLHQGNPAEALRRTAFEPGEVWSEVTWIWLHWYVALRAEAAVLTGHPDAEHRITAAREITDGNPIARAQLDRAGALLHGDVRRLPAIADAFTAAGARYQSARTLLFADTERGTAALAGLGLTAVPPRPA